MGQFSKICHLALKNMDLGSGIRDPGSGKNLFRIPDPGVKKAPDPGSGFATLTYAKFESSQYEQFQLAVLQLTAVGLKSLE